MVNNLEYEDSGGTLEVQTGFIVGCTRHAFPDIFQSRCPRVFLPDEEVVQVAKFGDHRRRYRAYDGDVGTSSISHGFSLVLKCCFQGISCHGGTLWQKVSCFSPRAEQQMGRSTLPKRNPSYITI